MEQIKQFLLDSGFSRDDNNNYIKTFHQKQTMIINGQQIDNDITSEFKLEYLGDGYYQSETDPEAPMYYFRITLDNEDKGSIGVRNVDDLKFFLKIS